MFTKHFWTKYTEVDSGKRILCMWKQRFGKVFDVLRVEIS